MGELDIAAKALLHEEPAALARLALGSAPVQAVAAEETELASTAVRMDKLLRYTREGEDRPRWLHVEVQALPTSDMPRRMFDYWSRAHQAFDRLTSALLALKPGDRRGDPQAEYVVRDEDGGDVLRFRFRVVKLWELPVEGLLAAGTAGLLPLVPFAAGSNPDRVEQAMRTLAAVGPRRRRAELQAALAAFAGNVFPGRDWLGTIPREILMESTVYRQIKAEGELEGLKRALALLLRERLGVAAEPLLVRIDYCSEDTLTQGVKLAASAQPPDALAAALDALFPQAPT